jgi:hypothetical protein
MVSCVKKPKLLSKSLYYLGFSSLCQGIIMAMLASELCHIVGIAIIRPIGLPK